MHALERQVLEFWPTAASSDHPLLICCSGGPDSMALLRVLLRLREPPRRLAVAHFNHGLRGDFADQDELFVRAVCQALDLDLYVGRAELGSVESTGDGVEAAARNARYQFILDRARQLGARYVATGHNADDQAETVLLNLARGTGLAGITGIPFVRTEGEAVSIVRPLLSCTRQSIEDYLTALHQDFRHDVTNDELHFRRNRVRHEVIPLLEAKIHPNVRNSLRKLARIASEAQEALRFVARSLLDGAVVRRSPETCELALTSIPRETPAHLRREIFVLLWQDQSWPLQSMTFEHWQQLASFLETPHEKTLPAASDKAQSTVLTLPGSVRVELRDHGTLRLERNPLQR